MAKQQRKKGLKRPKIHCWYLDGSHSVRAYNQSGRKLSMMPYNKASIYVHFGYARWDTTKIVFLEDMMGTRFLRQYGVRQIIRIRENKKCFWCKACDGTTIDHVLPSSWGGPTIPENCVWACHVCNHNRGNTIPSNLPDIWRRLSLLTSQLREKLQLPQSLKDLGQHFKTGEMLPSGSHSAIVEQASD